MTSIWTYRAAIAAKTLKIWKFENIKKEEKRKIDMIREVVNIKKNVLTLDNMEDSLDEDEFNDIIHYLSTS